MSCRGNSAKKLKETEKAVIAAVRLQRRRPGRQEPARGNSVRRRPLGVVRVGKCEETRRRPEQTDSVGQRHPDGSSLARHGLPTASHRVQKVSLQAADDH